ncbi:MAG: CoA pyrophosphatase [SAR324 cluster bacterium]|nr:CoA pyrophosphatase [SAR324 cluster bacterium]
MTSATDIKALFRYTPRKIPGRKQLRRSCTTVILDESPDEGWKVLLIQRARKKGDPWSGHMAFPGGRLSENDPDSFSGALRELKEEIGMDAQCIEPLGRLSDVFTLAHRRSRLMIITPFVFRLTNTPELQLNHEVDQVVWIPLSFFLDQNNRKQMTWKFMGKTWTLPCYDFQSYRIWGLTLITLDEVFGLFAQKIDTNQRFRILHPTNKLRKNWFKVPCR